MIQLCAGSNPASPVFAVLEQMRFCKENNKDRCVAEMTLVSPYALVTEQVYVGVLKTPESNLVWVQVPLSAFTFQTCGNSLLW